MVEVVSEDDLARDYVEKRADYAEAGIPEYWTADPSEAMLTVLSLDGSVYLQHGAYHVADGTTSPCTEVSFSPKDAGNTPTTNQD